MQTGTPDKNTTTWADAEGEKPSGEVCPICKGAGIVHPRLPSGKPDYGKTVPCQCIKKRLDKERFTSLQRLSNLGALTRLTFDNLIPEGRSGNPAKQKLFQHAYEAARSFARQPKGWLVLLGPSGSGKTHLAAAIANHCIQNNQPVFYITAPDLLDHLRSSFNPDSELPYDEFFEQVRNTPLLVLDDLGAQSTTPWAKEKLDQLLNHRFSNQLTTVVVPIVPIEELEERLEKK